jgi:Gpi18-like mannosyltransferase
VQQLLKLSAAWLLTLIGVVFVTTQFAVYRSDFAYTSINHFNPELPLWLQKSFVPLANFDGVHYLQIAGEGYVDQGRFLPLYPGLLAIPTQLFNAKTFGSVQLLVSVVISWSIFVAMIWIWQKLLLLDHKHDQVWWTLLFFISFPTSFFLISIYSEALFLLLAGLSFWLARKGKWGMALLPAALLSVTRLTGFVMIPTLVFMYWQQRHFQDLRTFIPKHFWRLVSFALPILPLLAYAYFNFSKWGDWLYFVNAHGALGNSRSTSSLVFPLITLYRYLKILISLSPVLHEFKVAALELASFFAISGLFVWGFVKKVRWEYLFFSGLAISIPILSGTLTGFPRYSLAALPLLSSLSTLPKNWKLALIATGFILQAALLALHASGYFVA